MGRTKPTGRTRRRTLPVDVQTILDRLEKIYGETHRVSRYDPLEELVCCILSQHTTDATSFPAFDRLRKKYPEWQGVVDAGPEKVAEIVRKAGLANQKAKNIIRSLEEIKRRTGGYSIDHLRAMPMREAREWLTELPGVGPKTASIVLCFSFDMGAIPVDTHVYRVSTRLGVIPESADENKAHDLLLDIVEPGLAFRFHTALILHGRRLCKAPVPLCDECPLQDVCPWFKKVGPDRARSRLRKSRKER